MTGSVEAGGGQGEDTISCAPREVGVREHKWSQHGAGSGGGKLPERKGRIYEQKWTEEGRGLLELGLREELSQREVKFRRRFG